MERITIETWSRNSKSKLFKKKRSKSPKTLVFVSSFFQTASFLVNSKIRTGFISKWMRRFRSSNNLNSSSTTLSSSRHTCRATLFGKILTNLAHKPSSKEFSYSLGLLCSQPYFYSRRSLLRCSHLFKKKLRSISMETERCKAYLRCTLSQWLLWSLISLWSHSWSMQPVWLKTIEGNLQGATTWWGGYSSLCFWTLWFYPFVKHQCMCSSNW